MSEQRTIEAYAIPQVKDFEIPRQIHGFPLGSAALTHLLENIPAQIVTPELEQPSLPFNDASQPGFGTPSEHTLFQASPNHKRSFEIDLGPNTRGWHDEFGNSYCGLSLKGNNFSQPGIMEHPTAAEGYIAYGLQESSIIERVLKASQLLRSRGIATEYVMGIAEPKSYPWPIIDGHTDATEFISLKEYKQRVVEKHWRELPDEQRTTEKLVELHTVFKDMTYYISLRATDSPFRLWDMRSRRVKEFTYMHINTFDLKEGEEPLDPTNYMDEERYLKDYFAPKAGRNLARLHVDLSHGFANSLNLTTLGGIVDLDSIKGTALGMNDEPVTDADRIRDLMEVLLAMSSSFGLRTVLTPENTLSDDAAPFLAFMDSYFKEVEALASTPEEGSLEVARRITLLTDELQARTGSELLNARLLGAALELYYNGRLLNKNRKVDMVQAHEDIYATLQELSLGDELNEAIKNAFEEDIEIFVSIMACDFIDQINAADAQGEPFNMYDAFVDKFHEHETEAKHEMITAMRKVCETAIYFHMKEHGDLSKYGFKDLSPELAGKIWRSLIVRSPDILLYAQAFAAEQIFENEDRLRKEADYFKPASLLTNEKTSLRAPIQDNRFWRLTEEVDSSKIEARLDALGASYSTEKMTKKNRNIATVTTTPGLLLHEIITDTVFDGHLDSIDEDEATIEFGLTDDFSYILVAESDKEGIMHYRLLLPKKDDEDEGQEEQFYPHSEFVEETLF